MRNLIKTMFLLAGVCLSTASGAAVIDGQIRNIDGDGDGFADDLKISRVMLTVTAGTRVFFDSLVREDGDADVNGDGVITGFDNYMALFDGANLLAENDDSGDTFGDGSVHYYDSTLDWTFANAGTYMVTLGQLYYDSASALQGFQADRLYVAYDGNENFGAWRLTMTASDGTLSGVNEVGVDPANVPEPASIVLLGAGFLGFAAARRKSARRKHA